jgi:hypothetical protein
MLFRIKDIPIGTTRGAYQFLEKMRADPELEYDDFSSLKKFFGTDWRGWWIHNKNGCIYHSSWLEKHK